MINVTHRFYRYEDLEANIMNIEDDAYVAVGYPSAYMLFKVKHVMNNRSGHMTHAANYVMNYVRGTHDARFQNEHLDSLIAPFDQSFL